MADALLIVDMVNDFVTGVLKCERAQRIIPNVRRLADAARGAEVPVIYGNDAHLPEDFELKIWGAHAMKGTPGAQTISALREQKGDEVLGKRTYSAFYETPLDTVLRAHDVTHLAITGLHTNICCRHTSAGTCPSSRRMAWTASRSRPTGTGSSTSRRCTRPRSRPRRSSCGSGSEPPRASRTFS